MLTFVVSGNFAPETFQGCPYIKIGINTCKTFGLLDSGASLSVINENLIDHSKLEPCDTIVCDLSGSLNILGKIKLNLTLNKINVTALFIVVSNKHILPANVIIGSDILSQLGAKIDFDDRILIFNGGVIPICEKPSFNANVAAFEVISKRTTSVLKLVTSASDGTYLLKPVGQHCVVEGLITVKNKQCSGLYANLSEINCNLNKNCMIAELEPVCENQISTLQSISVN